MLDIHFDNRGEMGIENVSNLLRLFPRDAKRAIASGMKSEGYRIKELIKLSVQRGGLHGEWPKLNPHTGVMSLAKKKTLKNYRSVWRGSKGNKRRVRQYKDSMTSTRSNPLAKFAGAARYVYDDSLQQVGIGFVQSPGTSKKLRVLAKLHAQGWETPLTPKMRKFLFAVGFPVKKATTSLKNPPRPIVGPVFDQEKNKIMQNIEAKFIESLARNWSGQR